MTLTGLTGTTYTLDPVPIGSGGEGDVYRVLGGDGKVAKLYKPGAITQELVDKLMVMIHYPPSASVLSQVAWPLDLVGTEPGTSSGFVMPELSINTELGEVYKYPATLPISMHQKINIAQNICVAISEVHKAGYVFGDFNPRNIGLDINTGLVSFLDTDTYHVEDKEKGTIYRCNVCASGYAAPELLEKCSDYVAEVPAASKSAYAETPLPTFTKETDNFALAIHIFKLLMNGYTPFGGIIETASVSQSSPGVGDAAVRRDSYCFKPGYKHQSAAIPPLEALPQEVADLFTRAFIVGKGNPRQRPDAVEWHKALSSYEQSLVNCADNPLHQYDRKNSSCPFCEADRQYAAAVGGVAAETSIKQVAYSPPDEGHKITSQLQPAQSSTIASSSRRSRGSIIALSAVAAAFLIVASVAVSYIVFGWGNSNEPVAPATAVINAFGQDPMHEPTLAPDPFPTPSTTQATVPLSAARVGDIIEFGEYRWCVLYLQDDKALVLSENIHERRVYHNSRSATTWENSSIREYLNNEFFSSFSGSDRSRIAEMRIINNNNLWYGTTGGNITSDRIFLLSLGEVANYFGDSGQLWSRPDYSSTQISDQFDSARVAFDTDGGSWFWWLRSPGSSSSHAATISSDGTVSIRGTTVNTYGVGGVRPALWLYLES